MSEDNNALKEVERKVTITPEDCAGAAEFWDHFEIPMPSELKQAFEKFALDPSVENQDEVKLQICRAIAYTEHDAFKDEMFKEIIEECRKCEHDMSFNKHLESILTTE